MTKTKYRISWCHINDKNIKGYSDWFETKYQQKIEEVTKKLSKSHKDVDFNVEKIFVI